MYVLKPLTRPGQHLQTDKSARHEVQTIDNNCNTKQSIEIVR